MKATVTVMLKQGVLDPQGEAVKSALGSLGFQGVAGVRQGKVIELDLAPGTTEAEVTAMCEKLLANTVIESYRVEMGA
ncbi:phosphoribosylformylglycinamidine synthase subunit PurS [Roseicyclus mahoneyensis]|uniref:Phosphoribosylformylglycinamidine synthase subunit PurS n=1 Tax=Roseicyclus mahoneyensis TaxID=164332 RepID=A0A316H3X2_9RHOB|nr:phosphoribosylformylglycinamidine synthase subunit PurS [Roseicyclus mahoneyensis]PWK62233.1 phosphoribosylformylglycinamidine synthase [Roseicyclus mahoneyensis]